MLLSPEGRTLATARRTGDHYRVELRDTWNGRLLHTLPSPQLPVSTYPSSPVLPEDTSTLLAFTPDSRAFAYGISAPSRESPPPFTIRDLTEGRTGTTLNLATPTATGAPVTIALGLDARTLYACRTQDVGTLSNGVWDTAHHRKTAVLAALAGSSHLAVSPDGSTLAVGGEAGSLQLWDIATQQPLGSRCTCRPERPTSPGPCGRRTCRACRTARSAGDLRSSNGD